MQRARPELLALASLLLWRSRSRSGRGAFRGSGFGRALAARARDDALGLMSLLAWLTWCVAGRRRERPPSAIFWVALVVTAIAFGAGHLGAAGAQLTLTSGLVSWIVVANAIAGVDFRAPSVESDP